jgi:hypothetical protein
MKKLTTKALLLAIGAALAARTASAQNNVWNNGDLMLGLREAGVNDLVIDIGQASTYLNTTTIINLDTVVASYGNVTYPSLASLIDHVFTTPSGVTWSVVGTPALGSPFSGISLTDPANTATASSQASLNNAGSAFQSYTATWINASSGNTLVQNLAAEEANSLSGSYTKNGPKIKTDVGFNEESVIPVSGSSTADLFSFTPGNAGTQPANMGYFEMDANGNGFYVPTVTPEPSTTAFGIVAGAGLLLVNFRRRFSRRNA